ncbi:tail protein X [Limnobaculum xujianqingii]|uniref:tail protein X n=1 Tax=Limnobaculum xujianqingii TaxID=2738837 RepID=UPI00112A4C1A|nr:tail protein X [Limnobaculum xujianqingii]
MKIQAQQGDTVDEICMRYYGRTAGVTEAVYEANPGLCNGSPMLAAGQIVYLPDIAPRAQEDIVQLWN